MISPMKIAIAATAPDTHAPISQFAGRAPCFLLFDKRKHLLQSVTNPHTQDSALIGIGVAELLNEKGVSVFVAGNVGPRLREALENRNIRHLEKTGKIGEVLNQVLQD